MSTELEHLADRGGGGSGDGVVRVTRTDEFKAAEARAMEVFGPGPITRVGDWEIIHEKPADYDAAGNRWLASARWGSSSAHLVADPLGYMTLELDEYTSGVPLAVVLTLLSVAMARPGEPLRVY